MKRKMREGESDGERKWRERGGGERGREGWRGEGERGGGGKEGGREPSLTSGTAV